MNEANQELINSIQNLFVELDEQGTVLNYISTATPGYVPVKMPEDPNFFRKEKGQYCHVYYNAEEMEDGSYVISFNPKYKLIPEGMAVYEFDEKGKPISCAMPYAVEKDCAIYPSVSDLSLYILSEGTLIIDQKEKRVREIKNELTENRNYLNQSDYKVLRRVREKELKIVPETMNEEEYIQLEEARHEKVVRINDLEEELRELYA